MRAFLRVACRIRVASFDMSVGATITIASRIETFSGHSPLNASTYLLESTVPILPYDASAAEWHASERARLTRLGRTPPFVDGQIAAVARLNGLEVVTTNVEDYLDFEGITVRDWRS